MTARTGHRAPGTSKKSCIMLAGILAAASSSGLAGNGVALQNWGDGAGAFPSLSPGGRLEVTREMPGSNFAGNPRLEHSAWAHLGDTWWRFHLAAATDVVVHLAPADPGASFKPGLTVWASGDSPFDGGASDPDEVANNGWDTPHSFNAVGQVADDVRGTWWMGGFSHCGESGDQPCSNMKETLAYVVTGPQRLATEGTGWNEDILWGAHDVSVSDTYENGISGDAGGNWARLIFHGMQPGWYVIFAGGTEHGLPATDMRLSVMAVPEPESWAMLLAGLGVTGLLARRRSLAGRHASGPEKNDHTDGPAS